MFLHRLLTSIASAFFLDLPLFYQSIQLCLTLLAQLAQYEKINEEHYCKQCLTSVLLLWTMTDRTVRTALLSTLKCLVVLTPADQVNKSIFDPLLAGFADSNAK